MGGGKKAANHGGVGAPHPGRKKTCVGERRNVGSGVQKVVDGSREPV